MIISLSILRSYSFLFLCSPYHLYRSGTEKLVYTSLILLISAGALFVSFVFHPGADTVDFYYRFPVCTFHYFKSGIHCHAKDRSTEF